MLVADGLAYHYLRNPFPMEMPFPKPLVPSPWKVEILASDISYSVLRAGQEVQTPLRGFLRSREQAEDLARAVKAATAALSLGRDQYKVGTIPFNTVFNLETTQVQQQDNLALAQGNIALNLINVYRYLGGGWEVRFARENGVATPAVDAAANQHGWQLYNWTKATCPPLFGPIISPVLGRTFTECETWRQNVLARIAVGSARDPRGDRALHECARLIGPAINHQAHQEDGHVDVQRFGAVEHKRQVVRTHAAVRREEVRRLRGVAVRQFVAREVPRHRGRRARHFVVHHRPELARAQPARVTVRLRWQDRESAEQEQIHIWNIAIRHDRQRARLHPRALVSIFGAPAREAGVRNRNAWRQHRLEFWAQARIRKLGFGYPQDPQPGICAPICEELRLPYFWACGVPVIAHEVTWLANT